MYSEEFTGTKFVIENDVPMTRRSGYEAMIHLTFAYQAVCPDIAELTDILSAGEYWGAEGSPADELIWYYWLDALALNEKEGAVYFIETTITFQKKDDPKDDPTEVGLTEKTGYEAMLYALLLYHRKTKKSEDLLLFSEQGAYNDMGVPNNMEVWDCWLAGIETLNEKGPKYKEFLGPKITNLLRRKFVKKITNQEKSVNRTR